MSTPGSAEYLAQHLNGRGLGCSHFPKYHAEDSQGLRRYPSRLGFFYFTTSTICISFLDTKKLCEACLDLVVPKGFNYWSNLPHTFFSAVSEDAHVLSFEASRPPPGVWPEVTVSNNTDPKMFQAGAEGFNSQEAQMERNRPHLITLPLVLPISLLAGAEQPWSWLVHERKPFYIPQLHITKGWHLLTRKTLEADQRIALLVGVTFEVHFKELAVVPLPSVRRMGLLVSATSETPASEILAVQPAQARAPREESSAVVSFGRTFVGVKVYKESTADGEAPKQKPNAKRVSREKPATEKTSGGKSSADKVVVKRSKMPSVEGSAPAVKRDTSAALATHPGVLKADNAVKTSSKTIIASSSTTKTKKSSLDISQAFDAAVPLLPQAATMIGTATSAGVIADVATSVVAHIPAGSSAPTKKKTSSQGAKGIETELVTKKDKTKIVKKNTTTGSELSKAGPVQLTFTKNWTTYDPIPFDSTIVNLTLAEHQRSADSIGDSKAIELHGPLMRLLAKAKKRDGGGEVVLQGPGSPPKNDQIMKLLGATKDGKQKEMVADTQFIKSITESAPIKPARKEKMGASAAGDDRARKSTEKISKTKMPGLEPDHGATKVKSGTKAEIRPGKTEKADKTEKPAKTEKARDKLKKPTADSSSNTSAPQKQPKSKPERSATAGSAPHQDRGKVRAPKSHPGLPKLKKADRGHSGKPQLPKLPGHHGGHQGGHHGGRHGGHHGGHHGGETYLSETHITNVNIFVEGSGDEIEEVEELEVEELEVEELEVEELEVDELEVDELEVDELEIDELESVWSEEEEIEIDGFENEGLETGENLGEESLDHDPTDEHCGEEHQQAESFETDAHGPNMSEPGAHDPDTDPGTHSPDNSEPQGSTGIPAMVHSPLSDPNPGQLNAGGVGTGNTDPGAGATPAGSSQPSTSASGGNNGSSGDQTATTGGSPGKVDTPVITGEEANQQDSSSTRPLPAVQSPPTKPNYDSTGPGSKPSDQPMDVNPARSDPSKKPPSSSPTKPPNLSTNQVSNQAKPTESGLKNRPDKPSGKPGQDQGPQDPNHPEPAPGQHDPASADAAQQTSTDHGALGPGATGSGNAGLTAASFAAGALVGAAAAASMLDTGSAPASPHHSEPSSPVDSEHHASFAVSAAPSISGESANLGELDSDHGDAESDLDAHSAIDYNSGVEGHYDDYEVESSQDESDIDYHSDHDQEISDVEDDSDSVHHDVYDESDHESYHGSDHGGSDVYESEHESEHESEYESEYESRHESEHESDHESDQHTPEGSDVEIDTDDEGQDHDEDDEDDDGSVVEDHSDKDSDDEDSNHEEQEMELDVDSEDNGSSDGEQAFDTDDDDGGSDDGHQDDSDGSHGYDDDEHHQISDDNHSDDDEDHDPPSADDGGHDYDDIASYYGESD
ncbi:hypothetical protein G7054_g9425 [Neopestalotiopsis clavispora]|nr:hypothetical protein G7054_g9425 [Neopestalotiopsis clavispora]